MVGGLEGAFGFKVLSGWMDGWHEEWVKGRAWRGVAWRDAMRWICSIVV